VQIQNHIDYMKITIDIDPSNIKAQALLEYIRTLDFIRIQETESSKEYSLSKEEISILEERKENHKKGASKSYSWDEIKDEISDSEK